MGMANTLRMIACLALLLSSCNQRTSDMDASLYIQQAVEGLRAQSSAHSATWHLGDEENWAADQENGRIKFTFSDGTIAEADMQIVGTYNTDDDTFLWGWDHPSVEEPLRAHAKLARQFGEQHEISDYTERKIQCTEDEAWEYTAVAARLGNANGAYRGPSGTTLVYMTFGEIKLHCL